MSSMAFSSTAKSLLGITAAICAAGLLFVFEASLHEGLVTVGDPYYFVRQHALGLLLGWAALAVGLLIPTKLWYRGALALYILGLLSLILVLIPGIGQELNGARRWIIVGGMSIQPIEFVKFSMVIFLASWLHRHQRLRPFLFVSSLPVLLTILQPDLGSLLVLGGILVGLYFVAGGNMKHMAIVGALGIPSLIGAIVFSPYRWQRVVTLFNPELNPQGSGFHMRQITLALGRGGWLGQGIGNSQQREFIPEASTDSIFAIVAEEIGFLGSLGIILLYALYFYMAYRIVHKSQEHSYAQLVGFGILVWVAVQTLLNMGAVVALVPLTGLPLPFFSYGRSALIMLLFATGVLVRTEKAEKVL